MREPRRPTVELVHIACPIPPQWSDHPGWRFDRSMLVAPDGKKINARRLMGLMWRENMELRRAGYASRRQAEAGKVASGRQRLVKVVIVDLAEYRKNGNAAA